MREALQSLVKEPRERIQSPETGDREFVQTPIIPVREPAGKASDVSGPISSGGSDEPEPDESESDEPDSDAPEEYGEPSFDFPSDGYLPPKDDTPSQVSIWSILVLFAIGVILTLVIHPGHPTKRQSTQKTDQPVKTAGQEAPQGPRAEYETGRKYLDGTEARKDPEQAFRWFQKAAWQGYAPAQNMVGMLYARGEGVERNDREAVQWYRRAAKQEQPEALYNVGNIYENGYGVDKDLTEAMRWYRKAADKGNKEAADALKRLQ